MPRRRRVSARKTWLDANGPIRGEAAPGVYGASFSLSELARRRLVKPEAFDSFRRLTKLGDFTWRALWTRGAVVQAGGRGQFLRHARAIVVFIHGWDGSGAIWENLPAEVCAAAHDCLVLVPDVNGFGDSPFAQPQSLAAGQCTPEANMRAVEKWLGALRLLGGARRRPVIFVGHSMGGASLFYLNERLWSGHHVARCAVAPALLTNDILRKGFYRTLGAGIFAGTRLSLDSFQNRLAPFVISQLIAGASKAVQAEHRRIFRQTPKATIAHTFDAMGIAKRPNHGPRWDRFQVILGHSDRLVGVSPMLDLLADLGFTSRQMRVVLGDHYFFSINRRSQSLHQENRIILYETICKLIAECTRK